MRVRDVNDKPPRLTPPAQRASVSADAAPGRLLLRLAAADADASGPAALRFARAPLPVRAVDSGGNEVRVARPTRCARRLGVVSQSRCFLYTKICIYRKKFMSLSFVV